jgi:hypothetical protein
MSPPRGGGSTASCAGVHEHFFIVGAQRSATTYLYHLLAEHPEIAMAQPVRPEPKFFLLDPLFERGLQHYHQAFWGDRTGMRILGEKTTSYMESEQAAQRIAATFPDARIVFLLRDPIARAVSHYWFSVQHGWETLPISDAFLREDERWLDYDRARISASPYAYLHRGRYIDYVQLYLRWFPRAQLTVLLHEQLTRSLDVTRDLYGFLGASRRVPLAPGDKINAGEHTDEPLAPELARYLVEYFAEPNARLAQFLGIPLHEWRRDP